MRTTNIVEPGEEILEVDNNRQELLMIVSQGQRKVLQDKTGGPGGAVADLSIMVKL
jgi:hypothetical protein